MLVGCFGVVREGDLDLARARALTADTESSAVLKAIALVLPVHPDWLAAPISPSIPKSLSVLTSVADRAPARARRVSDGHDGRVRRVRSWTNRRGSGRTRRVSRGRARCRSRRSLLCVVAEDLAGDRGLARSVLVLDHLIGDEARPVGEDRGVHGCWCLAEHNGADLESGAVSAQSAISGESPAGKS